MINELFIRVSSYRISIDKKGNDTHVAFKLIREKLLGKSSTRKQNVFCYWSRMQS